MLDLIDHVLGRAEAERQSLAQRIRTVVTAEGAAARCEHRQEGNSGSGRRAWERITLIRQKLPFREWKPVQVFREGPRRTLHPGAVLPVSESENLGLRASIRELIHDVVG